MLSEAGRRELNAWVHAKFDFIDLDDIGHELEDGDALRLDDWVEKAIEDGTVIHRQRGEDEYEGQMIVVATFSPDCGGEEVLCSSWSFGDLRSRGVDPLADDQIYSFLAVEWSEYFDDDDTPFEEFLASPVWSPKQNSDARSDGVDVFIGIAGSAGFFVFCIENKLYIGLPYDADDREYRWGLLYQNLTGRRLDGRLAG